MELTTRTLPARKHIALVAHDHCKKMLMSWVERHQPLEKNTFCMQPAQPATLFTAKPGWRSMPC
jgi:methylglyoxal synthase